MEGDERNAIKIYHSNGEKPVTGLWLDEKLRMTSQAFYALLG